MAGNTYYTRSFSSFSGADIRAVFANVEIGTLQAISYAIQREKAPIYVMGSPDPRAFSRGKRGIAGTMIFVMFDDHALLSAFENNNPKLMNFVKDNDEISPTEAAYDAPLGPQVQETTGDAMWSDWSVAAAYYVDQIPPFDVTVTAVNETAGAAVLRIWGCDLLNEGYGISVDDMVSETQTTYVARGISRWRSAGTGGVPAFPAKAARQDGGVVISAGTTDPR